MQKIYTAIFTLLCCICHTYAQEVQLGTKSKDTIPQMEISDGLNLNMPNFQWEQQIKIKNDPFYSLKKINGYNDMYTHSVDDVLYYSLYSDLHVAPGLYTTQTAGAGIGVQINRSFLVNFGAYGMKHSHNFGGNIGAGPFNEAVLYIDASYKVLPWLIVGAYGQYAALSIRNAERGSILPSPIIPYSAYGIHATTMFTETFGIQGLVGKEFNPIQGKWQPVYGIAPVINLDNFFK